MRPVRLMTLDPTHFHAALLTQRRVEGVHPRLYVYSDFSKELLTYLEWMQVGNSRLPHGQGWEMDVRASDRWRARAFQEQPGNTAVITGANRSKIDLMLDAVRAGLHVIADKGWIVDQADFPMLETLLSEAELREVILWEMLPLRHKMGHRLLRELLYLPEVFGELLLGSPDEPALTIDSTQFLRKSPIGLPVIRPMWWLDHHISGHVLADSTSYLVDLALWILFPGEPILHIVDAECQDATGWATPVSEEQFHAITGIRKAPEIFRSNGQIMLESNGLMAFTVRGVHARTNCQWDFDSERKAGDIHDFVVRGSRSRITLTCPPTPTESPWELLVTPNKIEDKAAISRAMQQSLTRWRPHHPGLSLREHATAIEVVIPNSEVSDSVSNFEEILSSFVNAFRNPRSVPGWEITNKLARYYLTTRAAEIAEKKRG
ncbi:MAG: putative oxidoreductase C-terminal domain-containing protein [Fimbriiglobus sp.]